MKTFVITGTTSGIGRALLEKFSKNNLVFAGFRNTKYEAELAEIENVTPFYIDMEKPETIESAAEFIKSKIERVDVLINAAGCVIAGAMEHMDADRLRKQFQVNTFSHLEFTQRLLPVLAGGRVLISVRCRVLEFSRLLHRIVRQRGHWIFCSMLWNSKWEVE